MSHRLTRLLLVGVGYYWAPASLAAWWPNSFWKCFRASDSSSSSKRLGELVEKCNWCQWLELCFPFLWTNIFPEYKETSWALKCSKSLIKTNWTFRTFWFIEGRRLRTHRGDTSIMTARIIYLKTSLSKTTEVNFLGWFCLCVCLCMCYSKWLHWGCTSLGFCF